MNALRCHRLTAATSFLLAAGCVGTVGDQADPGVAHGSPGATPDSPASAAMTSTPGAAPPAAPADFRPGPATLRRLTVRQYANSLADLLGPTARPPTGLEPDLAIDGFVSVGAAQLSLSARATEQFESAAEALGQQVMADPAWRASYVPCRPAAASDDVCARAFVTAFGRRAWRRPLAPDEVSRYARIADDAARTLGDFWRGLAWALAGLLESPHFLYRVELGAPDAADPSRRRLGGFELASRLAYFLSDSTPDDALLNAASSGELDTPAGLRAQEQRLLSSPRARVAMQRFFAERLRVDDLPDTDHPAAAFPKLTPTLLAAMQQETLALADDLVFGRDADLRELLDGRSTFVNDELAAFYGYARPGKGATLVKVAMPPASPRAGYLGQGSFLALNAHQSATSPTRRGKFVREVLLCQPIPPPPPDANPVLKQDPASLKLPMRQRLEAHRADPTCAACHALMDPIGLAFESFDAVGAFRATDNGQPIDARGVLDGAAFDDAVGLATRLHDRPETALCLARGLYRYAGGHVESDGEEPAIVQARAAFEKAGFRFRALIEAVVEGPGFRFAAAVAP